MKGEREVVFALWKGDIADDLDFITTDHYNMKWFMTTRVAVFRIIWVIFKVIYHCEYFSYVYAAVDNISINKHRHAVPLRQLSHLTFKRCAFHRQRKRGKRWLKSIHGGMEVVNWVAANVADADELDDRAGHGWQILLRVSTARRPALFHFGRQAALRRHHLRGRFNLQPAQVG